MARARHFVSDPGYLRERQDLGGTNGVTDAYEETPSERIWDSSTVPHTAGEGSSGAGTPKAGTPKSPGQGHAATRILQGQTHPAGSSRCLART
jgi:hypothetical protein